MYAGFEILNCRGWDWEVFNPTNAVRLWNCTLGGWRELSQFLLYLILSSGGYLAHIKCKKIFQQPGLCPAGSLRRSPRLPNWCGGADCPLPKNVSRPFTFTPLASGGPSGLADDPPPLSNSFVTVQTLCLRVFSLYFCGRHTTMNECIPLLL